MNTSAVGNSGDRGRALVLSLVEHQGLKVSLLEERTISIALTLKPPAAAEPVELHATAAVPTDGTIGAWVREQNVRKPICACGCGRRIVVKRQHYWHGVPKLHADCRHKGMQAKRASITGDKYINGTELAKKLGIGRTTLKRRIAAGKLPEPEKSISGMLLFKRAGIGLV